MLTCHVFSSFWFWFQIIWKSEPAIVLSCIFHEHFPNSAWLPQWVTLSCKKNASYFEKIWIHDENNFACLIKGCLYPGWICGCLNDSNANGPISPRWLSHNTPAQTHVRQTRTSLNNFYQILNGTSNVNGTIGVG